MDDVHDQFVIRGGVCCFIGKESLVRYRESAATTVIVIHRLDVRFNPEPDIEVSQANLTGSDALRRLHPC